MKLIQKIFPHIYSFGTSVILKIVQVPSYILFWVYFSFIAIVTASLMSVGAINEGARYTYLLETFLDITIFLSILNQITMTKLNRKNLELIAGNLQQPFKKYPKHTRQFKIVQHYQKVITVCASAMACFVVIGIIFHGLRPLVVVFWISNDEILQVWPLPLGKFPMKAESFWLYAICYLTSFSCLLVSSLLYVSWFFILVCPSFHLSTRLKLLSLEVKALSVRVEERCDYRLSFLTRRERLKIPREDMVNNNSLEFLKQIVLEHVEIMRNIRLLDKTYRWITLGYCKAAIFITALALMIMVDEWKTGGSVSTARLNMTFSTLFFIFINSYSGQIIITESENLRTALYGISWTDKSVRVKSGLYIMLTAARRPLHLTAGNVFTLSMESYGSTMEAVYSFFNFLIALR